MALESREIVPLLAVDECQRVTGAPLRGRTKLTKLVFLAEQLEPGLVRLLTGSSSPYRFEPLHYGPFSRDLLDDLESLADRGLITSRIEKLDRAGRIIQHTYALCPRGAEAILEVRDPGHAAARLRKFWSHYAPMDSSEIVTLVHQKYPEFIRPSR